MASISILIVDDYKAMLKIMSNLLKQIGLMDITEAQDGPTALEKMRHQKFDLIIADWGMESMGGLDLLKEIKSDFNLNNIPFIMVAAESRVENILAAKNAGVAAYIVKPFNVSTFKSKIISALGQI